MLELRLLKDDDIPLAETWLNKEHVKRWYEIPHIGVSISDWMHELQERNGEYKWLTHFIVLWQGIPIGLCLYYKCIDSDEDFGTLPLTGSYGIDYLIGEEAYLGKGLGKAMVTLLVNKIFSFPDARRITADIDKENLASKMTLLSCGFSLVDAECSRYMISKVAMSELRLVKPTKLYAKQVMEYKEEMLQNGDSFDGCAGLEDVQSFDEWVDFEERLKKKYKEGYVPSEVYLAVREKDDTVVGIIDFRHPLSDFLFNFGGHIGYCIRPSERRKGYAAEMLRLILPICLEYGERKVLLTCDKDNEISRRTIIKNGGVLENEVADTVGLGKSGVIQRFWISFEEEKL